MRGWVQVSVRVLVSLCDRIDKDGILKLNLTRIVSRASINSVNVSHKQAHLLALVSHILSYANSFSVVHIRTLLNQSRKHHLLPAILLAALTFSATVHINPPSNHPLLHPITLFNHWVIREYSRLADLDDDPSNALPSNEEMRPYLVYLQQAVVQSVHPDDSMAVRMADMQIRYDLGLYYVVTENWLQAAAYLRQCVILESLLDDSTASQFLDIKKARLHQLMQLCQRLDQSKTKTLLQEGDAINHHFHLATFLDMRRRTDFGSTFVSLVLQDISTPFQIGTDVRASVMRELFAEADRWLGKGNLTVANKCVGGAVKLAYINALLDVHLGSATMQANLPHVFYRYMQSPGPTGAELVSAVLAILAKYIALPGLPTQHRSMAIRFTWTLVQRGVGTLEAFRGLLNKKLGLFAEMENLDAVAIQRACWIKNANSMSFAIPPQHLNDFLFLKRKLRTSLTDRDFDGLERVRRSRLCLHNVTFRVHGSVF
ncbi:hypothetical protein BC830DRAFT_549330 [Chytriomyces sp. MP71]|nr:hypothetical protein BC830DRAFT_549330 [Chytriomyces sp. MP71]